MTARKLTIVTTGLVANADDRTVTGLALPYGEAGSTNLGKVTASRGSLSIADRIVANMEHDPTRPLAVMTSTDESDEGRTMTFSIPRTRAGDDLLEEIANGLRTGLSVEVSDPVIRAGALVAGTIDGVAFCVKPAFPSAQLAASDVGDLPVEDDPEDASEDDDAESVPDPEDADADVEAASLEITPDTTLAELIDALPTDPPAEDDPAPTDQEGSPVTASARPLAASAAPRPKLGTVREFSAQLAAACRAGDRSLIAALADITQSGIGGDIAAQKFLGELWSGKAYQRRFVPLMTQGTLDAYAMKGWRWTTKPEVYDYAGNKAAVTSETVDTEAVEVTAARLAGAHDIDRKFVDFGDAGFLESYQRAMTESYARKSDGKAVAFLEANATAISAGTVPSGITAAAAALVDGALALVDVGSPSFAIMGDAAFRSLLLTPKDQVLEYLSMSLGLEEGAALGFKIVPGGSAVGDADVIVGIQGAATFFELPGVPIRVDALNIANGGVDAGLFGYYATLLSDADGLVKTQPAIGAGTISAGADFAMTVGDADGSAGPTVLATYPDGSVYDVTGDAVLTSATPAKATIVSNLVHPVAAGTSVITATYQGKTDTVTVTVS